MAVAHSIFNLGGRVQLFWTAFDMPMTGVPLKVALGWHKFDFWAFKKNNHANANAIFNGTTVTSISKAAQNN